MNPICLLLQAYLVVLLLTAVLSWFPLEPGSFLASALGVFRRLTDPVLEPLRRVIPPAGMFDLSFFVLVLIVGVLISVIC